LVSGLAATPLASGLVLAAAVLAGAGLFLAGLRLLRGPTAPDRAVALDVLTLIAMPAMVGLAVVSGRGIYLDVALVYGLLSFLGVLSLARYFDRGL